MSAIDFFPWLPDWQAGVSMRYRFDTVIAASETGNDISRSPIYDKPKRSQIVRVFSPACMASIENFLRKHHADFFQVPVFSEPIMPLEGLGLKYGDSLKNVTSVLVNLLEDGYYFNLINLCTKILMIDLTNQSNAELHTFVNLHLNGQLEIGGAFSGNFYLGRTAYYPCMEVYVNGFGDALTTPRLQDTDLTFEEYF